MSGGAAPFAGRSRRITLPAPVARIFEAITELEHLYPGRKFTLDGHLAGSIGEVIAAEAFNLTLYPQSFAAHDARDEHGRDVQIKMVGSKSKSVSMYATSMRLIVLQVITPQEAELVYDGPGAPVWLAAGPMAKNGQRSIRLKLLQSLGAKPVDAVAQ